jgi:hypothetical protein
MSQVPHHTYHRETIDHMGLDAPRPSEVALARLDERERTCGVPFPAAVREWYALEAGLVERELHFRGSLLPLECLGDPYPGWSPDGRECPLDLVGEGRLPVMVGDYGERLWAVDLDGSGNPPVSVMDNDSVTSVSEIPWSPHAGSFSAFILGTYWANAWIYRTGFHGLFMYQLRGDQPLSTADLAPLRTRFDEGPRTVNNPSGFMTARFTGRGVAFEIDDLPEDCAADGDEPHRACDLGAFERAGGPVRLRRWSIKGASDEALVRLARDLREWGLLDRLSMYTAYSKPELEAILEPICVRPAG